MKRIEWHAAQTFLYTSYPRRILIREEKSEMSNWPHMVIAFTYLAWSNDSKNPLWFHGSGVGCTSAPEAWTDCSKAKTRAPAPPVSNPSDVNSCRKLHQKLCIHSNWHWGRWGYVWVFHMRSHLIIESTINYTYTLLSRRQSLVCRKFVHLKMQWEIYDWYAVRLPSTGKKKNVT